MKVNWERFPIGLIIVVGTLALSYAHGAKYITLPESILGSAWTLAAVTVYFYFRKSPESKGQ